MKLSQNLQRICKLRGVTLAQLSKATGVPHQTLHGWTTGRKSVNLEHLKKVSHTLQTPIHELLYGTPDPSEEQQFEELLDKTFSGGFRVRLHKVLKND